LYDYLHHNCFHRDPLSWIDESRGMMICMQCGEVFYVAPSPERSEG
jgi:hypothetical protein